MLTRIMQALKRYAANEAAIAAITLAFMLPAIMASAGIAVDLSTAYNARNRLSNALDKATLATASSTGTDLELQDRMKAFFYANYPEAKFGTPLNVKLDIQGSVMTASADVDVPTTFMAIFGKQSMKVHMESQVVRELAGIEAVLVLDVTGSMSGNNIAALKTASTNFLNTMFSKVKDPTYLKIGIVPWSDAVNVGAYGSSFVDTPTTDTYVTPASSITYGTGVNDWHGCVVERDGATAETDDPAPPNWKMYRYPSGQCTAYNCTQYACQTYNCTAYKCATYNCTQYNCQTYNCTQYDCKTCSKGSVKKGVCTTKGATCTKYDTSCLTQGSCAVYGNTCLVHGNTCTAYSSNCQTYGNTCVTYSTTSCLKYGTTCVDWRNDPNTNCPTSAVQPMTSDKAVLQHVIDTLPTDGNTYSNLGMVWGWRVISPDAPFTEGAAYSDSKWSKTVILMTDGNNTINSTYSGEGPYNATGMSKTVTDQNNNFETVCTNMKKKGIRVYTVTFQSAINATTKQFYSDCASQKDMYFDAPSNQDLVTAFQKIADQLSRLHLTK